MSIFKLFDLPDKCRVKGEVGIEIEVEGSNLPERITGWRKEVDGSLRGESAEYVLAKPILRQEVTEYLGRVHKAYEEYKSKVLDSQRAGVHVHINVQDLTVTQVYNFICLYLIFENMLVKYCGKTREGNLFCLRAQDAEALIFYITDAAKNRDFRRLGNDYLRYASINVKALFNYGSLEFRSMRGTRDMAVIAKWTELLLAIKDEAVAYEDPIAIIQDFSLSTPEGMFEKIFRGNQVLLAYKGYQEDMWESVRLVQDIAYATDWKDLNAWEDKIMNPVNPFAKPQDYLNGHVDAVEIRPVPNNLWRDGVAEAPAINPELADALQRLNQAHIRKPAPKRRPAPPEPVLFPNDEDEDEPEDR